MSVQTFVEQNCERVGRRLAGIYSRWMLWYLLGMILLALLGIESLYQETTPFYALIRPAFTSASVPAIVLTTMGLAAFLGWRRLCPRSPLLQPRSIFLGVVWLALVAGILIGLGRSSKVHSIAEGFGEVWPWVRWHLLAVLVFAAAFLGIVAAWRQLDWFGSGPQGRAVTWMLLGIMVFSFAFSGSIAMLRGGPDGIAAAYQRYDYEYIGDIGKGRTFQGLFHDYVKIHPYLSMHAKVHPPGPIVLLWMLSLFFGTDPLALSLATMAVGALGILPLYFWARDMTHVRTALTCCLVYALMPSIVLFTATSADITFTPFSILTLLCFWRALHRRSIGYALAAGALYALLSLISFSLISLGAFFGLLGLWRLLDASYRRSVIQTAALMLVAFLSVHGAVWLWSGFNVVECFHACKAQFDMDQIHLDEASPRYPAWTFRVLNPLCWAYFAGIPASVLFVWRLRRPEPATKGLFVVFALTLLALDLLYVARGEGERSAMYILPFVAIPAAHLVDELGRASRSFGPMAATLSFLAFQCWFTESYFYTYW